MMIFAGIAFIVSLALISTLFALKIKELETGKYIAPRLRQASDIEASHLKDLLFAAHVDLKKIPPLLVYWGHMALHFLALEFARGARTAALSAHSFADF